LIYALLALTEWLSVGVCVEFFDLEWNEIIIIIVNVNMFWLQCRKIERKLKKRVIDRKDE
jgi:hypothetical protein